MPPRPYVLQSGNVTVGHAVAWAADGTIEDAGFVAGAADVDIDVLPPATSPLDGTELVFGEQGGIQSKITTAQIAVLAGTALATLWIPATAMIARTTNGPSTGLIELSVNKIMVATLDFDPTTQEYAQFSIRMPKSWNESTLSFAPLWSHAATATTFGVVWSLSATAYSNDDALDVAQGAVQTSTDTGGTTNDLYIGPTSSAITVGGTPDPEDMIIFQVSRVAGAGSDTMTIDARLHGVTIYYNTNTNTDA